MAVLQSAAMLIPKRIPGWRGLLISWGVYGVMWIALEGWLWRAVLLGVLTTAVLLIYLLQKHLGGRRVGLKMWLAISAVLGLGFGLGSGLLTLVFMAVKTGLHAHGPEFTPSEIGWVMGQMGLWTAVGLLVGLGLGLLAWGVVSSQ
ncbi:MAG: hypothetical protein GY796_05795 [Chloroflexi bacterium]|nr:hypothetical protein [Chloroflexota bacterium]